MTGETDNAILEFANSVEIAPSVLIDYVYKWSSVPEARLSLPSKIIMDYVDACVIGKKSIDEFYSDMKQVCSRMYCQTTGGV